MLKSVSINDFTGGLVTLDEQSIEDNQLTSLKNFFYNKNKRPQTRKGYTTFGQPVPDTVVAINNCNAITDITASLDATTLATGTAIKGSNSVSFTIDVSNDAGNQALVTWAGSSTVDISSAKDSVRFYLYVPAAFNTNLTAVKFRVGSDSSNYYEWTLSTLTEASNNFIVLDYADATSTGTPDDTAIDYFLLDITYTASYTDKTGVLIDWIYSYSATATEPVTSYMYHKKDDSTQLRTALIVSGANMFEYDETTTDWVVIDEGLTKLETKTGLTTHRTRWDYDVYKNIFYMCNGVDNYRAYNGTTITEYGSQPKFRYLKMEADRMFGAGDDDNPISLYYDDAAQADAATPNANTVVVGGDQQGKINGINSLGNIILCGKDKKVYGINVSTPSADPIDARAGLYSNRSVANVGDSMVYFTDNGVDTLKQRSGVSGSSALESGSLTDDLRGFIDKIDELQYNACAAFYAKPLRNYYFTFDTNNDNIPDTTLVYSSLTKAWSQYTLPALYQYGEYEDSSGVIHYLIMSANGGQVYEIETGFDDNGVAIDYEIQTKDWNFGNAFLEKDFENVDIAGLSSTGQSIDTSVIIDNEEASAAVINDTFIDETQLATTISSSPIGTLAIGGGGTTGTSTDLDMFPYKIRVPIPFTRGFTEKIKLSSSESRPIQFTLDRISLVYNEGTFDVFPIDSIA